VAVIVPDVRSYLLEHVKGIAQAVPEKDFPPEHARALREARAAIQAGHIEDDLEAERVIALYLMTHYLKAQGGQSWWRPRTGEASPLVSSLVREYWDHGPFSRIERLCAELARKAKAELAIVELGCGTGGLARRVRGTYLGVDSSFAAVALARHLILGAPYRPRIRIPEDLLQGPVSRELRLETGKAGDGRVDFVVGGLEDAPVARGQWDVSVALNTIDMLEEPAVLPEVQFELLKKGGTAVQSCPYVWHEAVARKLRGRLPKGVRDSAGAAEWLYERAGFEIGHREAHVPWLFFKHVRQLEIYSVHLFAARKA
jgi:SAM-dependent methyltransferase